MEAIAKVGYVRITPRKMGEIAREIRGKSINDALNYLRFSPAKRTSGVLSVALRSAVANFTQKRSSVDVDQLFVKQLLIGKGPTLKRYNPRAKGAADSLLKKTSNVTVVLGELSGKDSGKKKTGVKTRAAKETGAQTRAAKE